MIQEFDDSINDLWSLINRDADCVIYLKSTVQKSDFAEGRIDSLKANVSDYKTNSATREWHGRQKVEMDFDHVINSLRSSIEHLAQLINSVAKLGFDPTKKQGNNFVNICKVKDKLLKSNDNNLRELGELLKDVIDSDWYEDLNDLRIELYHHQFKFIPKAYEVDASHDRTNRELLLPGGTAPSISDSKERQIEVYCDKQFENIHNVLETSFRLLIKYLTANN